MRPSVVSRTESKQMQHVGASAPVIEGPVWVAFENDVVKMDVRGAGVLDWSNRPSVVAFRS